MEMSRENSPFVRNIGLMMTYRCTVACSHCMVEAAPYKRESMSVESAQEWIRQARGYRSGSIAGLTFTGGEPFYDIQVLRRLSDQAAAHGFMVSAATNAFWAASTNEAEQVLKRLPALSQLIVSTDEYHLKCIPLEHVRNAVEAARKRRMPVSLTVCTDSERTPGFSALMYRLSEFAHRSEIRVSLTSPVGRAKIHCATFHYLMSETPSDSACPMAGSPVIFPDGRVFACMGPVIRLDHHNPLLLGKAFEEPLQTILDRSETNPVLRAVCERGPQRLISLLEEGGFGGILPRQFIQGSACDVCYRLFSSAEAVGALESMQAAPVG
jgi:MoaA/NifB/PqqE/SkfB family radical SAM enzyme